MQDLSNYFFVDGVDLWKTFSLYIAEGGNQFLKYPKKKQSIEYDWPDAHGAEVDLTRFYFQKRTIQLKVGIVATDNDDFFRKRDSFILFFTMPGLRRMSFTSHGARSYFVHYEDNSTIQKIRNVTIAGTTAVFYMFTLTVVEPNPSGNNGNASDAIVPILDDLRKPILT